MNCIMDFCFVLAEKRFVVVLKRLLRHQFFSSLTTPAIKRRAKFSESCSRQTAINAIKSKPRNLKPFTFDSK